MNSYNEPLTSVNPLKSYGDSFWKRHLKCFFFLKYITVYVLDFFSEKHKFHELILYLSGLYISGINSEIIGSYSVVAGCDYLYPVIYIQNNDYPNYLKINNDLSVYMHYFFPLLFIGNYRKAPVTITGLCAILNAYDMILRIYDVVYI